MLDPWAQLDAVAGADNSSTPSAPPTQAAPSQPTPPVSVAADPWSQLDAVAGADKSAPQQPALDPNEDTASKLRVMLDDPKVKFPDLQKFYTDRNFQLTPQQIKVLQGRDEYNAAHPGLVAPIGTVKGDLSQTLSGPVDNRPDSFGLGMIEGGHHVLANVVKGLNYIPSHLGLTGDAGSAVQNYYDQADNSGDFKGSSLGRVTGGLLASAPAALVAAPLAEAGLATAGAPGWLAAGGAMAADGASQSALNTNANTVGGVAKDAAVGAGLGLGFGGAARALHTLAATPTAAAQAGRAALNEAQPLGIHLLPADVGGPIIRRLNAGAKTGLISGGMIDAAEARVRAQAQAARDGIANGLASSDTAPTLHDAADALMNGKNGLGDYAARSQANLNALYDNAANKAQGATVPAPSARAALDSLVSAREARPGVVAGLEPLRALRDDLTPSPDQVVQPGLLGRLFGRQPTTIAGDEARYPVQALRDVRTDYGDNFDSSNRSARVAAQKVWGPLSDDLQSGLRAQGLDASADAFKAADQAAATRFGNLDDVVNPVLGNRSVETLANHIRGMTRNDGDTLNKMLQLVSPEQAANTRGAIVGDLGNASAGRSGVDPTFSFNELATHWNKVSPIVKEQILNGSAGDQLQSLARVAERAKLAGRYSAGSNTADKLDAMGVVKNLLKHVASKAPTEVGIHALGAAVGAPVWGPILAETGLGAMMSSPAVARGIVKAGEFRPIARTSAALAALGRRTAPTIADGDEN